MFYKEKYGLYGINIAQDFRTGELGTGAPDHLTTTKTNMIPNPYKRQRPSQEHHVQQTFNGNTYVFNNASFEASTFEMVMNTITKNQQK